MRALAMLLAAVTSLSAEPIKVACVGDSITQGVGADKGKSYPSQLQALLGDTHKVGNFGVSGRTLLSKGDKPYIKEKAYQAALAMEPDIVIIMLGTNDTKPQNWKFEKEFEADYRALVKSFQALKSKPRIFLCRPSPGPDKPGNIYEGDLRKVRSRVDKLASSLGCKVIDMNAALAGKPGLLADTVHPNAAGAAELAKAAAKAIQGK
jgi:lysophospholipase L1-like esterase